MELLDNSNRSESASAPALVRGLDILDYLAGNPPKSLEEIARETEVPKSTALRLLKVLVARGVIARDVDTKNFRSLVRLVPLISGHRQLEETVENELLALAQNTGFTAEWYGLGPDFLEIISRKEPEDQAVTVRAQIGFRRPISGEFEAVIRAACATGHFPLSKELELTTYRNGVLVSLPLSDARNLLEAEYTSGEDSQVPPIHADEEFNSNGIRRAACSLVDNQGDLLGVLAVAEAWKPPEIRNSSVRNAALARAAANIQTTIREINQ